MILLNNSPRSEHFFKFDKKKYLTRCRAIRENELISSSRLYSRTIRHKALSYSVRQACYAITGGNIERSVCPQANKLSKLTHTAHKGTTRSMFRKLPTLLDMFKKIKKQGDVKNLPTRGRGSECGILEKV
jgi:hypothetical protein